MAFRANDRVVYNGSMKEYSGQVAVILATPPNGGRGYVIALERKNVPANDWPVLLNVSPNSMERYLGNTIGMEN